MQDLDCSGVPRYPYYKRQYAGWNLLPYTQGKSLVTLYTNQTCNWTLLTGIHLQDVSDMHEDWNQRGNVQDMLASVEGWDPEVRHIIQHIPADSLIDHKILWRDPVQKWVSEKGRICLVGDAAHPHLPTAGTGAAQAIEDAATIGALMQKSMEKSGKAPEIPAVFRAYERLR
jgi:2-polyprenyl-6-methoxyphenol hydroxylase-like FAD-dependent oxidoreductase